MPEPVRPTQVHDVPLSDLTPHPHNPRRGNLDAISASLRAHGQYRPLLVHTSTGHIITGNHTHAAATRLGWTHIAVQFLDVDEPTALSILLADNRTGDLADYDSHLLGEALSALDDLASTAPTGYTDTEVDQLINQMRLDLDMDPLFDVAQDPEPIPQAQAAPEPRRAPRPATPDDPTQSIPDPDQPPSSEPPAPPPVETPATPSAPPPSPPAIWTLTLPTLDRTEAAQLTAAARKALDPTLDEAQVVLRALRVLVAATDARHNPDATISVGQLLHNAE